MARASAEVLQRLQPLLIKLREIPDLTETKPGTFYVKRIPMLHFHETESGTVAGLKSIVADLKRVVTGPGGFDRFDADSDAARRKLLEETRRRCEQLRQSPKKNTS